MPSHSSRMVRVFWRLPHPWLTHMCPSDFPEEKLQALIASLKAADFQPYVTAVGGSGLGILSPYDEIAIEETEDSPPLSPPATPDPGREDGQLGEGMVPQPSIRTQFESVSTVELSRWASGRGKWLYV